MCFFCLLKICPKQRGLKEFKIWFHCPSVTLIISTLFTSTDDGQIQQSRAAVPSSLHKFPSNEMVSLLTLNCRHCLRPTHNHHAWPTNSRFWTSDDVTLESLLPKLLAHLIMQGL